MDETPKFIYGTAWKKEETSNLVLQALKSGFRRFDTAGQPKHYCEDAVGDAIVRYLSATPGVNRSDLFITTKFSRSLVQNPENCPYPLDAPLDDQVHASIASSLENLVHESDYPDTAYIDCLLLHSPFPTFEETFQAWRIFETFVPHKIRALGISTVSLPTLERLYDAVDVKPSFAQVRFHPETQFEVPLRKYCRKKGIVFQAHKVLKGNKKGLLRDELIEDLANVLIVTNEVALYLFIMGLEGVWVVNGTKNHMKEGMEGWEKWKVWVERAENRELWALWMNRFRTLIGDERA